MFRWSNFSSLLMFFSPGFFFSGQSTLSLLPHTHSLPHGMRGADSFSGGFLVGFFLIMDLRVFVHVKFWFADWRKVSCAGFLCGRSCFIRFYVDS